MRSMSPPPSGPALGLKARPWACSKWNSTNGLTTRPRDAIAASLKRRSRHSLRPIGARHDRRNHQRRLPAGPQNPAGESVDLVLTDPPYGVGYRDRSGRSIANDTDLGPVLASFRDIYRVLKPDRLCVAFYGWNKPEIPDRLDRRRVHARGSHRLAQELRVQPALPEAAPRDGLRAGQGPPAEAGPAAGRCPGLGIFRQPRPSDREGGRHPDAADPVVQPAGRAGARPVRRLGQHLRGRCPVRPPVLRDRAGGTVLRTCLPPAGTACRWRHDPCGAMAGPWPRQLSVHDGILTPRKCPDLLR